MKYYLQAGVVATDFFSEPVPRDVFDDQVMIFIHFFGQCAFEIVYNLSTSLQVLFVLRSDKVRCLTPIFSIFFSDLQKNDQMLFIPSVLYSGGCYFNGLFATCML